MAQVRDGVKAIKDAVEINVACSLGILTREQGEELRDIGVHRYNHNLETARSHFRQVVTTHTWEERWETLALVREMGMEVCCGGIIGMGESLEQRAEFASELAELEPDEVPMNFLDPRPGTPFAKLDVTQAADALRAIAAFRLALPRTVLRFAGGRELNARRSRNASRRARRHQRRDRRQLPDDARTLARRGPRSAGRAKDADQGALERRCELLRGLRTADRRRRSFRLRATTAGDRSAALLHGLRAQAACAGPAAELESRGVKCGTLSPSGRR